MLSAQDDGVYIIVKKMPEFPGGTDSLAKYLRKNLQYPAEAREAGITGKVYLNFIVDTSGRILSPRVIKSSGNKALNDEALRVIGNMPNWVPGSDSLKRVKVSINLPVNFAGNSGANERSQGFTLQAKEVPAQEEKKLTLEEKAAKEKHDKAMKFHELGIQQAQQERWEFAIGKFDQCLKIEPNNRYALSDKANMYVKLKRYKEACEVWALYKSFGYESEKVEGYIKTYCKD